MEVGNVAPESMPVKSMVDYSDSTSADVHHQDQEQSKEMEDNDAPPQEPEKDSFDVFGKMLSPMPAKPADEEEEGGEPKNEDGEEKKEDADEKNEDSEDKKDT